jgi:hypothetical protein
MGGVDRLVTQTALAIRDADELEVAASVLDAALRRAKVEGVGETIESVTQWANETFGPATLGRQIQRAKEELAELEAIAETANYLKIAEEAADVCICLFRVMGSIDPEALNRKMTVNRTRQWRVDGDGCAYHVKAARAAQIEEGE